MSKEIYLTASGLKEIQDELDELKNVKRPEVITALKEARALGDLSENVDTDKVSIGTTVTIEYVGDNDTEAYSIVGSKEADPFNNKISNESPIAQAIMGKKTGDVVSVDSPNGKYDVKILKIA